MSRGNYGARGASFARDPAVTTAGNVGPAQGWWLMPARVTFLRFVFSAIHELTRLIKVCVYFQCSSTRSNLQSSHDNLHRCISKPRAARDAIRAWRTSSLIRAYASFEVTRLASLLLQKSWHKRFCQLFRTSNYGIKRVEIYDNQEEAILQLHTPRIITLDACIKIAPSNQSHVFTVSRHLIRTVKADANIHFPSWFILDAGRD